MRVLGIDLGIRKIACAALDGEALVHAEAYEVDAELPRDLQLRSLAAYAHDAAQLANADSVWIEDTIIGNNRRFSIRLAETKGAVMAGLSSLRLQHGTDIRLVDNNTWKKVVVGQGHATKDQVKDYINVSRGAYAPLCGDDQDLYDAACIGLYGATILERAEHLDLQS